MILPIPKMPDKSDESDVDSAKTPELENPGKFGVKSLNHASKCFTIFRHKEGKYFFQLTT